MKVQPQTECNDNISRAQLDYPLALIALIMPVIVQEYLLSAF